MGLVQAMQQHRNAAMPDHASTPAKIQGSSERLPGAYVRSSSLIDHRRFKDATDVRRFCEEHGIPTDKPAANRLTVHEDSFKRKLKELEDLLAGKSTATAKPTGAAAPSPELEAAVRELAALRARAVTGITRVAELIRRSYQGDPQAAKAADGASKVDGSKRLLTPAVETQISALLATTDKTRRAALAGAARTSVANYRKAIAAHELLPDIDKSVFDPNLSVIEPYLKSLERTESLLGNIRA